VNSVELTQNRVRPFFFFTGVSVDWLVEVLQGRGIKPSVPGSNYIGCMWAVRHYPDDAGKALAEVFAFICVSSYISVVKHTFHKFSV